MRSLLVDDDPPVLHVLRDSVDWKAYGVYSVDMACNISNAKAMIEANTPDIIICDIEMPKGSGLDLIKWVRENQFKSQFIFLTCHENFEFASTAIAYDAIAYLTKPFSSNKVEAAIAKAVEKINIENRLQEYSRYSRYWLDNRVLIEQAFWRDILFYNIFPQISMIEGEKKKRHLTLDTSCGFSLVLAGINRSEMDDTSWDDSVFSYAFRNLTSEVIYGEPVSHTIFSYMRDDNFYIIAIIPKDAEVADIKEKCRTLVKLCEEHLNCKVTCYISGKVTIDSLAKTREELEEMDQSNIALKGSVFLQGEKPAVDTKVKYTLDTGLFNRLFTEGDKLKIANCLKKELEGLSKENKLDGFTLHTIHQDFIQVVYSVLYRNEIQAHILFSDPDSQKLFKKSENSIFDIMKWATFITEKTIDYIREIQQSESVVEKAKRYIQNNFREDIRREDVAASVFLTPDYLARIFKAEAGFYIKDYVNECRIGLAKELLLESNTSISDVAVQTGFDNFSYFSTVFKKITGMTPFEYRKIHKA